MFKSLNQEASLNCCCTLLLIHVLLISIQLPDGSYVHASIYLFINWGRDIGSIRGLGVVPSGGLASLQEPWNIDFIL